MLVASVGVFPTPAKVELSVQVVSTDTDDASVCTTVTTEAECVTKDVWTFVTALVLISVAG